MKSKPERGIGIMCGTSLDGLDLADVSFSIGKEGKWTYQLHATHMLDLPDKMRDRLASAHDISGLALAQLDHDFAHFTAQAVTDFIKSTHSSAAFVASHGVTVFHQPNNGFTTQLGSGAIIAAQTNLTTVSDFRQQDVTVHGQGAPLVPSCDIQLFSGFTHTLNLGGFANVSVLSEPVIGFDVAACNLILNAMSKELGLAYDRDGNSARTGHIINEMFDALNLFSVYAQATPPSLGTEWLRAELEPVVEKFQSADASDRMRTYVEHLAYQIAQRIPNEKARVLVSGGGAHNAFLCERIQAHLKGKLIVPDATLIDFKEAICFAFLGMKRLLGEVNVFASSTGAVRDSSAGAVYLP